MDSEYIRELGRKTHRGLEGQALHGFSAGGIAFGYQRQPVYDTTTADRDGHQRRLGVGWIIDPSEAGVVREIFQIYVTGRGLAWAYVSTLGLTITNPATIISFAALAATLGLGTGGSFVRPALVVVGVLLGSAAWWCILVIGASLLRARLTPQVVGWISTVSGLAIAVLGILAVISAFSG